MNNKIKEILEDIQYVIDEDDYWEVTKVTLKPLLDYITNLQQENERLKEWKEDLLKENIELESIRKEAIEYIKEMLYPVGSCVNGSDLPYESIESLLNILQNGSDK